MTTITKERLLTIKQWRETYGPGSNVVLPAEEAEELARIALASLEAEAVATFYKSECGNVFNTLDSWLPVEGVNKLYTEPQLPQPAVPNNAAAAIRACLDEFPEDVRDIVEECASIAENACRASMLHDSEPETDTTNQQFESLSRGDK